MVAVLKATVATELSKSSQVVAQTPFPQKLNQFQKSSQVVAQTPFPHKF